jgi:hypothetical protein
MAKMTGKLKTAKKATKQTPSKSKTGKVAANQLFKSKFAPDATVTWTGKENPFREKSGAWERTEIVRKASGQKVSSVQSKDGMRGTTLATLARMELIKVAG